MLAAAWWTAAATTGLAVLALVTAMMAVLAYRSQNKQLRALETQAAEQHAVNIRQIEVLDAQLAELQEVPKIREREAEERQQAEARTVQQEGRLAARRRRAQAEKIFLTEDRLDHAVTLEQAASGAPSGPVIVANVRNVSDMPVYDLTLTWHRGSAPWGEFERVGSLMPGEVWRSTRALPDDLPEYVDPSVFGAVAWFRDDAGNHWRRRPDGGLDLIPPGQPLP